MLMWSYRTFTHTSCRACYIRTYKKNDSNLMSKDLQDNSSNQAWEPPYRSSKESSVIRRFFCTTFKNLDSTGINLIPCALQTFLPLMSLPAELFAHTEPKNSLPEHRPHSYCNQQPEESSLSSASPLSSHLPWPFTLKAFEEKTVL